MMMQVGRGLKAVAAKGFADKIRNLASVPTSGVRVHSVHTGKDGLYVGTVPVNLILDKVSELGLTYLLDSDKLVIAKRR